MIKISLGNIDEAFKALEKKALLEIEANSKKTAEALVEDLVKATPIDTGHARESWELTETKTGFDITNSAEYIEYLNSGSSKQAPSHFIESTALQYGTPIGAIVDIE